MKPTLMLQVTSALWAAGCASTQASATTATHRIRPTSSLCEYVEQLTTTQPTRGLLWIDGTNQGCTNHPSGFVSPSCTEGSLSPCTEGTFECTSDEQCSDRLYFYYLDQDGYLIAQVRRGPEGAAPLHDVRTLAATRLIECAFFDALVAWPPAASFWELTPSIAEDASEARLRLVPRCDGTPVRHFVETGSVFDPLLCRTSSGLSTCSFFTDSLYTDLLGSWTATGWQLVAVNNSVLDGSPAFDAAVSFARSHSPNCDGLPFDFGDAGLLSQPIAE